jgi:2,4-didehydro-3-deoxy-L-rhamnonate hydrolase
MAALGEIGAPFALGTFDTGDGRAFPGLVLDGGTRVADLSERDELRAGGAPLGSTRQLFEDWDEAFPALRALAERLAGGGAGHDAADLRSLPPVEPRQILMSGANYYKHVIELGIAQGVGSKPGMSQEEVRAEVTRIMDARAAGGVPYVFLGAVSALCGAEDDVVLPLDGAKHDWELELTAVIAGTGRHVPEERAGAHIAGYTIVNDLSTRDRLYRGDLGPIGVDWLSSKAAPTFLPAGPVIVPAAFVPDVRALRIRLALNGQVMQDESVEDIIFGPERLVAYASSRVRILPGDLLPTGSPAGNGQHWGRFLRDGDVMVGEITGLGRQRNRCVDETLPEGVTAFPTAAAQWRA